MYDKLKAIYLKYGKEKENPFELYCREVNGLSKNDEFDIIKHGIKSSNNIKSPVIVKLRYYSVINDPYLLNKKTINKKDKTYIALDSLSQIYTSVFYNKDKNCFAFMPIYTIYYDNVNCKPNNNDPYYKEMYKKYIGNDNVIHIVDLYNGNYIEVEKKNGSIINGCVSCFHKSHNMLILKNEKSFTKSDVRLIVYDRDVLGNQKKRLTFEIK